MVRHRLGGLDVVTHDPSRSCQVRHPELQGGRARGSPRLSDRLTRVEPSEQSTSAEVHPSMFKHGTSKPKHQYDIKGFKTEFITKSQ